MDIVEKMTCILYMEVFFNNTKPGGEKELSIRESTLVADVKL